MTGLVHCNKGDEPLGASPALTEGDNLFQHREVALPVMDDGFAKQLALENALRLHPGGGSDRAVIETAEIFHRFLTGQQQSWQPAAHIRKQRKTRKAKKRN